jgi:hypothetical protein
MPAIQPDPVEVDLRRRESEAGWQGICERFALAAAPTWFNWLEWILVLGAFDYLSAKSGAWLPRVAAAVSLGLFWMHFNAFFFRLQLKGWFGIRSTRVERGVLLQSPVCSLLGFGSALKLSQKQSPPTQDRPNQSIEPAASRRIIQLFLNSTRQSAAMRALIHSRDSFSLRPGVYVIACQSTPFARAVLRLLYAGS